MYGKLYDERERWFQIFEFLWQIFFFATKIRKSVENKIKKNIVDIRLGEKAEIVDHKNRKIYSPFCCIMYNVHLH